VAWSLDVGEQQRLVSAFLQIDTMRKRSSRDLYLTLLERELGHHLPLTRHEQDLLDVWQLVETCLTYSGAIHMLVAVLERFHGRSHPMREVRNLVEELLPDPLLDPPERRELGRLLMLLENGDHSSAHQAALPDLYRQAVGPVGPVGPMPARGTLRIREVIAQLEEVATGADGVPPLLVFMSDLAEYANGADATALREWVTRCGERLGIDWARLHRLGRPSARAPQSDAYLVIECRPDGADSSRYLISAWLQVGAGPGTRLQCDEEPVPLNRLHLILEALLINDQRVVGRHAPDLTVEFVLPRSLLGAPLDQLKITVEGFERSLGIEYPVVVRSHDRLRRGALHHNWRRKWNWLQGHPAGAGVCWVSQPREADQEWLFAMLSERSSVCLAMAFPPWGDDLGPADELWVGLQAGAPIIVWCRDRRDPVRFISEIRDLLSSDLMSLPQKVLNLRQEAVRTRTKEPAHDHLGFHLTLVFDDADRLPEPYIRLRAPA
jgi:vWA-MoxR associated protein C-terminal domain/Effector-associated domain 2/vWA-MoxR associated protein middle region 0